MATRLKAAPVATTTATTELKLDVNLRRMLLERLIEHQQLAETVKAAKGTKKKPGRMKRIEDEVDTLFIKARQGKALLEGTELGGHKMKQVLGKRKVFDQLGFMKKHGVTQEDFDEFTTYVDNDPYIKITHPGESEEE
jgi:hypothetical protein